MTGVVVVTRESRGIGAACAQLAVQTGWNVTVNYNASREGAEAVVADIEPGGPARDCGRRGRE